MEHWQTPAALDTEPFKVVTKSTERVVCQKNIHLVTVNSMWELQKQPYRGDVVNSYNDGGKLGKFYELESSSAALSLKPGASATHRQQTMHFQGDEKELDTIAKAALGVGLKDIRGAFKH